jgi:hypothetical protein
MQWIQFGLSFVSVIFAALAAIFSFLIWRSNITMDIYEQEKELRESFEDGQYSIKMPESADVMSHEITIDKISCSENNTGFGYRLKKLVCSSDGDTSIKLRFDRNLREHQGIPRRVGFPDIYEELQDHPWYNEGMFLAHPPERGGIIIDIYSSDTDVVEKELFRFIEIVETILVSKYSDREVWVKKTDIDTDS